jgi:hypothetical protein
MLIGKIRKEENKMKKMVVVAIAVLFSLVGVGYASEEANMAGLLKSLVLKVTYEEEIGNGSSTLSEGRNFVTVTPGIGKAITGGLNSHPVLYVFGGGSQIYISWISPNPSSTFYNERIWTVSCDLGVISMKPQVSLTKPPAAKSNSIKGIAACNICPDGIAFNTPGDPTSGATGLCNGGGSYAVGYLTFTGTDYKAYDTGSPVGSPNYYTTSVSLTGTVAGSAFDYVGEDWASTDGKTYSDWDTFPAIFTATFAGKVTPCLPDTSCITTY